jgi:hypothetical protein
MAHGQETQAEALGRTALLAIQRPDDRHALYSRLRLVLAAVSKAARAALEELMASGNYEFQSDFVKKFLAKGRAQGEAQGLLAVLEARGLRVFDEPERASSGARTWRSSTHGFARPSPSRSSISCSRSRDRMANTRNLLADLAKKYQARGHAEGYAEGDARGRREGQLRGRANALLVVIEGRGFGIPDEVRSRILGCPESALLDAWIARVAAGASLVDLFCEFQSEFASSNVAQGFAKGRAEGEAQGRARGEVEGRVYSLLAVLDGRGVRTPATVCARIVDCSDTALLDAWIRRAVSAVAVDELFRTILEPRPGQCTLQRGTLVDFDAVGSDSAVQLSALVNKERQ